MEYKVKNKLEQKVRYKGLIFLPLEEKVLSEKPNSDKFHIEKIRKEKKLNKEENNYGTRHME